MENSELIQFVFLILILVKKEILIFIKNTYEKLSKNRYDIILNSQYLGTIKKFTDALLEMNCNDCLINIYLFHNGGTLLNGVSMLKYSCIYHKYDTIDKDVLISSNKELIMLLFSDKEYLIINDNKYFKLFDKNGKLKGFGKTKNVDFNNDYFNTQISKIL